MGNFYKDQERVFSEVRKILLSTTTPMTVDQLRIAVRANTAMYVQPLHPGLKMIKDALDVLVYRREAIEVDNYYSWYRKQSSTESVDDEIKRLGLEVRDE